MAGYLNFAEINQLAMERLELVLQRWVPGGKRRGHEYLALNPRRQDKHLGSFSVNLENGMWGDFAIGVTGSDPISLVAYVDGSGPYPAAKALAELLAAGKVGQTSDRSPAAFKEKRQAEELGDFVDRIPPNHPRWPSITRQAVEHYVYRASNGAPIYFKFRFENEGGKAPVPMTLWRRGSILRWKFKRPAMEPLSLYGLEKLHRNPDAPVLVCEGERTTNAAQDMLPDLVCVTSANGSSAAHLTDWSPLAGRAVVIWPDLDGPGAAYAHAVMEILVPHECKTAILPANRLAKISGASTESGWDAYDAKAQGVNVVPDIERALRTLG